MTTWSDLHESLKKDAEYCAWQRQYVAEAFDSMNIPEDCRVEYIQLYNTIARITRDVKSAVNFVKQIHAQQWPYHYKGESNGPTEPAST